MWRRGAGGRRESRAHGGSPGEPASTSACWGSVQRRSRVLGPSSANRHLSRVGPICPRRVHARQRARLLTCDPQLSLREQVPMATLGSRMRSTSARTTGSDSPASGGSRSEARLFAGGLRGASSRRPHRAWSAASRASDPPTATAARSRSTHRTELPYSDKQPCWRTCFSPRAGARVLTARAFVERWAMRRRQRRGERAQQARRRSQADRLTTPSESEQVVDAVLTQHSFEREG